MYYVYFMIINKTCFHNGTYLQTSLNLYNYLQIETCTEIYPQPVCKKNIIKMKFIPNYYCENYC